MSLWFYFIYLFKIITIHIIYYYFIWRLIFISEIENFVRKYLNKRPGALENSIYESVKGTSPHFRQEDLENILNELPGHFKRKQGFIINTNKVKE